MENEGRNALERNVEGMEQTVEHERRKRETGAEETGKRGRQGDEEGDKGRGEEQRRARNKRARKARRRTMTGPSNNVASFKR